MVLNPSCLVHVTRAKLVPAAVGEINQLAPPLPDLWVSIKIDQRESQGVYLLWRLKYISSHRFSEATLVLLWTGYRRPILTTASESAIFDPGLQFLVPGVCTNTVNDSYH